jgi:hypothetical protein
MRMIAIAAMWVVLAVGLCATGNALAKDVPAAAYDAQSRFSGFAHVGGPKSPGSGAGANDESFARGNGGKLSLGPESAAGFWPQAR